MELDESNPLRDGFLRWSYDVSGEQSSRLDQVSAKDCSLDGVDEKKKCQGVPIPTQRDALIRGIASRPSLYSEWPWSALLIGDIASSGMNSCCSGGRLRGKSMRSPRTVIYFIMH